MSSEDEYDGYVGSDESSIDENEGSIYSDEDEGDFSDEERFEGDTSSDESTIGKVIPARPKRDRLETNSPVRSPPKCIRLKSTMKVIHLNFAPAAPAVKSNESAREAIEVVEGDDTRPAPKAKKGGDTSERNAVYIERKKEMAEFVIPPSDTLPVNGDFDPGKFQRITYKKKVDERTPEQKKADAKQKKNMKSVDCEKCKQMFKEIQDLKKQLIEAKTTIVAEEGPPMDVIEKMNALTIANNVLQRKLAEAEGRLDLPPPSVTPSTPPAPPASSQLAVVELQLESSPVAVAPPPVAELTVEQKRSLSKNKGKIAERARREKKAENNETRKVDTQIEREVRKLTMELVKPEVKPEFPWGSDNLPLPLRVWGGILGYNDA